MANTKYDSKSSTSMDSPPKKMSPKMSGKLSEKQKSDLYMFQIQLIQVLEHLQFLELLVVVTFGSFLSLMVLIQVLYIQMILISLQLIKQNQHSLTIS